MQFLLAIYGDEADWNALPPDAERQMMEGYEAFGREAGKRIVSGEALHPVATATTVRVRDGERLLTDGPFAETREQLGGYYVVDVADVDEAIELASKIPGAATGCVEVRPVVVFAADPQAANA